MTVPQRPTRLLSGRYSFPRDDFESLGGRDQCEEQVQFSLRMAAREGGHEPEGIVSIGWYDGDPGDADEPDRSAPYDPLRKWCRAVVLVRLHAAREQVVSITCPRCGSYPQQMPNGVLLCPRCDAGSL